jgi:membrane protease YdiL (CAAX protease family)
MFDPTEFAIIATFSAALCVFVMTSIAKAFWKNECDRPMASVAPLEPECSPYQPPLEVDPQPTRPLGRVPTRFYRRYDLLGIALIYGMFFALVLLSLRGGEDNKPISEAGGLIGAIGFQLITAGMVTAMVIGRVGLIEWLGLKWSNGWQVLFIAPGAVFGMWLFFGGLQVSGFMKWIESLGVETVQDTVKLLQESNDPVILTLMIVAAVIAAPICEEIVFRGYFYAASKRFAGPWAAGVCSALVFAAAHGSVVALLPLFVFGCLLALIYEMTGSILAPVAVHFCFNGATVLIQFAARYYEIPMNDAL